MLTARTIVVNAGKRRLLDSINLDVAPGELVALLGPNGSGKSTLVKCLAGLTRPSHGECRVNGRPIDSIRPAELARVRAVLTQETQVFGDHRCDAIVELGRLAVDEHAHDSVRMTAEAMTLTSTRQLAGQRYHTCSGGERQRVQLARVLAQLMPLQDSREARYLLLDEPISALDPAFQVGFLELIAQLTHVGLGVLVVLHDLNLAARFADRLVLLKDGRIAATGVPEAVLIPDLLEQVYDVGFTIPACHENGTPLVMPLAGGDRFSRCTSA